MWSLPVLPVPTRVLSKYSSLLPQSKDVCLSVSDAKLTIGVNGYAYRYDNPVSTVKPAYRLHPHYSELDKQQIKLMYR